MENENSTKLNNGNAESKKYMIKGNYKYIFLTNY